MAVKLQTKYHDILVNGIRKRIIPNKDKEARDWYRQAALSLGGGINKQEFIRQGQDGQIRAKHTPNKGFSLGQMYLFNYDPKYKDTLPVYDTFPLIFAFNMDKEHFWGINVHYLPHKERAQLMDILYTIASDNRYNRNTKINLSWKVLKEIADKELYKETVHCYLKKHVKSQLKLIPPIEWDIALFTNLARFRGKDAAKYQSFQ